MSPKLRGMLRQVAAQAARRRTPAYAVGGCVRDWLLGGSTKDVDLCFQGDALPLARWAARRWRARMESFGRFGTARLALPGGLRLDFARCRAETYERPAALPVVRPATLVEDLKRRDFTVNAMARALGPGGPGELIDPHGGAADLKGRLLRVLHPESFKDDPTRLFRAARYAARLKLFLEPSTRESLRDAVAAGHVGLLSRERVRQELLRLLEEEEPEPGFLLLDSWGLRSSLHPDWRWPESARREESALVRLGLVLLAMPEGSAEELLASLRLDRTVSTDLRAASRTGRSRRSSREPLSALSRRVLTAAFPGLPPAALKPAMLSGRDLQRLGLPPGRGYAARLEEAAAAQWRGEFSRRAQALSWLRRSVRMSMAA